LYEKCSAGDKSEIWKKRCVGAGLLLASSILLAMFAYSIPNHVDWEENFELFCFHSLKSRPFAETFPYAPMALVALGLLFLFLISFWPKTWVRVDVDRLEKWSLPLIAVLGFIIMWASLAILLRLRLEMADITGPSYQEADWGFGQVLAVVAWMPTLVQVVWELVEWSRTTRPTWSRIGTNP
jgi:hypothetical protein